MGSLRRIFQILRSAIFIDIYDLNYSYGTDTFGKSRSKTSDVPPGGYLRRSSAYGINLFRSLALLFDKTKSTDRTGQVMFFAGTQNQKEALLPIQQQMKRSYFAGGNVKFPVDTEVRYPYLYAYLVGLVFLPVLVVRFFTAKGFQRESFRHAIDAYLLTYGLFLITCAWLAALKPSLIIQANDHLGINRIVTKVAKINQIPIGYIQHASVTEEFPPLNFDFALLDGMNALQKYEMAGKSATKIFLIGTPKSDGTLAHINTKTMVETIGLCFTIVDSFEMISDLCAGLRVHFPETQFIIRPHPREQRKEDIQAVARIYQMEYSDPLGEKSFEYLRRIDAVIAGNSNILLEAAIVNVYPIKYAFTQNDSDYYGFEKCGLVKRYSELENLCEKVKELLRYKEPVRMKAKPFCATIGTPYDGYSTDLALAVIEETLSGRGGSTFAWKRVHGTTLEAFEPAMARKSESIHRTLHLEQ